MPPEFVFPIMTHSILAGHLAAFFANIFFGLSMPVAKALLANYLSPMGYTLLRILFAAAIFWGAGLFLKREHVPAKDLAIIALGGILGFIASQFLFAWSLKFTSPVNYAMLVTLSPVVVLLMSALIFREKVTRRKTAGAALGVLGALVIVGRAGLAETGTDDLIGLVFAFLSMLGYAAYLLISGSVARRYSSATIMKWLFVFTALALTPFGAMDLPQEKLLTRDALWDGVLLFGYIVIFATALGYFLLPVALRNLGSSTVSIYYNLQPVVASVAAVAVGQDTFTWDKPLAMALVMAGAFLVTSGGRAERSENQPPAVSPSEASQATA